MPDIIYEDANVLIAFKPAQIASHPGGVYEDNSFLDALKQKYHQLHLINRLDFDTSGIILAAHHKEAAAELNKQMFEKKIQKKYLCITFGKLIHEITINKPLAEKRGTHIKWKVKVSDQGKESITQIKPLYCFINNKKWYTLVIATPLTGRQHQIRVHLASIKHPIVGDKIYIRDKVFKYYTTHNHELRPEDINLIKSPRLLLHSYFLSFKYKGQQIIATCQPPADFIDFLDKKANEILCKLLPEKNKVIIS